MANTIGQISTRVYDYMSEKSTSTQYDFNTVVLPKIQKINDQICHWEMKDIVRSTAVNDVIYKAWDLRFLRKQTSIQYTAPTVTSASVSIGAVTITAGTTNWYATSGALWVWWQVVRYTGVAGNQFTGCTGVIVALTSWYMIYQAYEIPTDADRTFQLFNITKESQENEIPENDFKFNQNSFFYFKIVGDTTTSDKNYLYINGVYTDIVFMLYYYRKPTTYTSTADICDLPDNFGLEIIAPLVAGELMWETEMDAQARNLLTWWYANLHAFFNKNTSFNKKFRDKVQYKPVTSNYMSNYVLR